MRWLESLAEDAATLDAYLQAIARFPTLSDNEERALAEGARRREGAALARLVEAHLGLVVRYLRRYHAVGVPLVVLVRDGNQALIEAARRFDPARHGRFGPYARWWVRQGVLHRMAQLEPVDGPDGGEAIEGRVVEALQAAVVHAAADPGDELTDRDVRMLDAWWRRAPLAAYASLDAPFDLDAFAPALDASEAAVRRALVADLEASLLALDPRERRALGRRLGLDAGAGPLRAFRPRVAPARAGRLSRRAVRQLSRQRYLSSALN